MEKKLKKPALLLIAAILSSLSLIFFSFYRDLKFFKTFANEFNTQNLISDYQKINKKVKKISFFIPKNIKRQLFAKYFANNLINEGNYLDFLSDTSIILENLLKKDNNYLIFLQNNDELRSTGGFMGSYALVEIKNAQISPIKIEDIYDLSGQFTGYKAAPSGLSEYLSGGEGMQIQDSNWDPDLKNTAQTMISFYEQIAKNSPYVVEKEIDGLVMINLNLLRNLLHHLGPIELLDYQITVDQNNIADLARESRQDFFPGSSEKTNFLNALSKQLVLRLEQLNTKEKIALLNFLIKELDKKNLQLYSNNQTLEQIFEKYQIAGKVHNPSSKNFYFQSIESNVGINKANQKIERQITFLTNEQSLQNIEIEFSNHNLIPTNISDNEFLETANHLSYINYQRCYFNPQVKIDTVAEFNPEKNSWQTIDFSQNKYFNANGQEFSELAFLVSVPEQSQKTIRLTLAAPQPFYPLFIQKQSGIEELTITIKEASLYTEESFKIQSGNFSLDRLK